MKLYVGLEGIFTGVYRPHWEIGHIEVKTVELDGIIHEIEGKGKGGFARACLFDYPDEYDFWPGHPVQDTLEYISEGLPECEVRFRGRVIESGELGHMGMCHWHIEASEILQSTQIPGPAPVKPALLQPLGCLGCLLGTVGGPALTYVGLLLLVRLNLITMDFAEYFFLITLVSTVAFGAAAGTFIGKKIAQRLKR